jgi:hypothetical protein
MKTDLGTIIDHRVDSVALIDLGLPMERRRSCPEFMGPSSAPNTKAVGTLNTLPPAAGHDRNLQNRSHPDEPGIGP